MGCPTGWTMTMMGWMDHCYELHGVFFSGWNDAGGITFKNHIFIASSLSPSLFVCLFLFCFVFCFSVKVVLLLIELSCAIRVWIGFCSFSTKVYSHLYNSVIIQFLQPIIWQLIKLFTYMNYVTYSNNAYGRFNELPQVGRGYSKLVCKENIVHWIIRIACNSCLNIGS